MKKFCIKVAAMAAMMCAVSVYAHAQTGIPAEIPQIEMVHVKGGTFQMGCTSEQSDCHDDEKTVAWCFLSFSCWSVRPFV